MFFLLVSTVLVFVDLFQGSFSLAFPTDFSTVIHSQAYFASCIKWMGKEWREYWRQTAGGSAFSTTKPPVPPWDESAGAFDKQKV